MFWQLARRRLPLSASREDLEDAVQDVRLHAWRKSLPAFDTTKQTRATTWLFACADNYLRDVGRRVRRERRLRPQKLPPRLVAADTSADRAVEALAGDVIENPEKYLTRIQAEVFRAVEGRGGRQIKDVALDLGYTRQCSVSVVTKRAIERVRELAATL